MSSLFERWFHRGGTDETPSGLIGQVEGIGLVHWLDVTPRDSTDEPCTVESLDVSAHVSGLYAEVTQTLVLANPNRRPISASLTIPMPDRAVVCGYGLDIDGQMVDGVVVEKEKARVAFETEQRRGADPGLVEAVRGNVYNTRVYPIPPHVSRTLMLRYVAPLLVEGGTSATLDLPMPAEHLARRTLHIEVEMIDAPKPIISGIGDALLEDAVGLWHVETTDSDVIPNQPVRIAMPQLPDTLVQLERDSEGTVWFSASERTPEPVEDRSVPAIKALTVLWDASGSRGDENHDAELELLSAWCSAETLEKLTLVVFGDRVHEVTSYATSADLVDHVRSLRYDGGTNLAELSRALDGMDALRAGIADGHACVLFTDGLDTLSDQPFSLPEDCDALAVVTGTERDAEALRQACGGLAFDVALAPKDAAGLARALDHSNPSRSLAVRGTGISDVCDTGVAGSGRRTVIGRLAADQTEVSLGEGGATLTLSGEDAREGNVLARAWAARRVAQLSPRATDFADDLLTLGRRFGVASPVTSLLVLESLDQWLRYDIEPPKTWGRMHDKWVRAKAGEMRLSSEQERKDYHRRNLVDRWSETTAWWGRDFEEERRRREELERQRAAERENLLETISALRSGGSDLIYCPSCGSRVPQDLPFCVRCGHRLDSDEELGDGIPMAEEPRPRTRVADSHFYAEEAYADGAPTPRFMAMPTSAPSSPMPTSAHARPMPASAGSTGSIPADALRRAIWGDSDDSHGSSAPHVDTSPNVAVTVRPWMPDTPYLKLLDQAMEGGIEKAREAYHGQRREYRNSPSFFLDCAGWFMAKGDEDFGVRVLSNLAELRIEDAALLRVLAWRLREAGRLEQALVMVRRVLKLRKEDSQSHRDVALVLDELARSAFASGDEEKARTYAEEAGKLYRETALTPWSRRAMAIALFAVEEYNVLRAWASSQTWKQAPELPSLGHDLEGVLACDLRITLAWDADETDVDIHVTEPSGEEAYYGHRNTSSGGRVSEDITDGYGPELYEIRHAPEGIYNIRAHYFASHQQALFGPATCTLTVYTDWGKSTQTQQVTSRRLDREKEMVLVGTAAYGLEAVKTASEEDADEGTTQRQVERGRTFDEVREILGEPDRVHEDLDSQRWVWNRPDGRKLIVCFEAGMVDRVLERMPWGEEMIVTQ